MYVFYLPDCSCSDARMGIRMGCVLYIYTTLILLIDIIIFQVRSVPVRKDDEVTVVRGLYRQREGKVVACFRKKFVIHIERVTRERASGKLSFNSLNVEVAV